MLPGPAAYHIVDTRGTGPSATLVGREGLKSFSDEIVKALRWNPGVGAYDIPRRASRGTFAGAGRRREGLERRRVLGRGQCGLQLRQAGPAGDISQVRPDWAVMRGGEFTSSLQGLRVSFLDQTHYDKLAL